MKTAVKCGLFALAGTALFITGVAFGQAQERYLTAREAVERASILVQAVTPLNNAESRQRTKALSSLDKAHDQITCASLRAVDKNAACP